MKTYDVSVTWSIEARDPDEACEKILTDLDEAGIVVYSINVEEQHDESPTLPENGA